jgi:hypothetical protein
VKGRFPFLVQDMDVHGLGVKIDCATKFVLIGVKSQLASFFDSQCYLSKRFFTMPQEEALMSINRFQQTGLAALRQRLKRKGGLET